MGNIDLNAARAARAEAQSEPKTVTIGDKTLTLPNELSYSYAQHLVNGETELALRSLLNGSYDAFLEAEPSENDVLALIEETAKLYGMEGLGESSASSEPSETTSKRSRRSS